MKQNNAPKVFKPVSRRGLQGVYLSPSVVGAVFRAGAKPKIFFGRVKK